MTLYDVIRFISIATFGAGVGFMVLINVISFKVLRQPKKFGFLWWHITAISLSFLCLGVVAVEQVAGRLGDPPTWRGPVVLTGTTLFLIAQFIIFNIERRRLVDKQAREVAANVR